MHLSESNYPFIFIFFSDIFIYSSYITTPMWGIIKCKQQIGEKMETEKINVFVPTETAEILEKDARTFEIFKADSTVLNMNRFLSLLLIGYYDVYTATYRQIRDQISSVLEETGYSNTQQRSSTAELLIKKVLFPEIPKKKGQQARRISLKPTASTMAILINIENNLNGDTMSRYLCRLFTSYTLKPLNERERIIFKSTYDFLLNACRTQQTFSFTLTWNNEVIHEVLPYCIDVSKEELHNYLLCQEFIPDRDRYEARTFRMNRITHEHLSANTMSLDQDVKRHLEMMKRYGPQYPINDDEECCVRLTEEGTHLFNRIYFGRPIVDRIEKKSDGTYFYFKVSKFQLYTYFRRFDKDHAIILYPTSLRTQMIESYQIALDAYSSEYFGSVPTLSDCMNIQRSLRAEWD